MQQYPRPCQLSYHSRHRYQVTYVAQCHHRGRQLEATEHTRVHTYHIHLDHQDNIRKIKHSCETEYLLFLMHHSRLKQLPPSSR